MDHFCKCSKKKGKKDPETPSGSVNAVITVLNSLSIDRPGTDLTNTALLPSLDARSMAPSSENVKPVVVSIEEASSSAWSFSYCLELSIGDDSGVLHNIYLNDSDIAAQLLGCEV